MSMIRSKKGLIIIVGVIGLSMVIAFAFWRFVRWQDLFARGFRRVMYIYVQRKRVKLLYKTDHQALLEACRELSRSAATGSLKHRKYNIRSYSHPKAAGLPKAILDLGPNHVLIYDDGRVKLEMMGGLDHFGINAYPEDYKKLPHMDKLGDKKLIDGLWYYDDGYRVRPEDYDKRIEALRPKGR